MKGTQKDPALGLDCSLTRNSNFSTANDVVEIKGPTGEILKISFHRTIRVPDNNHDSNLPPSLEREAMWVCFQSKDKFAIKVYVGGVNAISGEPVIETPATRLRCFNLLANKKSVQDYVVTPDQLWLDGIASQEGQVRQFVAMPMGTGYTVEAQVTGEDVTGGLQFVITPTERVPKAFPGCLKIRTVPNAEYPAHELFIKTMTGKTTSLSGLSAAITVEEVKDLVYIKEGIPADQQQLIYLGQRLVDDFSLGQYNIPNRATIHLILRLRGGGPPKLAEKYIQLGVAAGGLIKQCILPDTNPASIWQRDRTICFNVQMLNSAAFRQVTGTNPPESPISAATYASEGLPFFEIYHETSDIKGDFGAVKSVKALDKKKAKDGKKCGRGRNDEDEPTHKNPIVVLDPKGTQIGFRPVSELEEALSNMNAVRF